MVHKRNSGLTAVAVLAEDPERGTWLCAVLSQDPGLRLVLRSRDIREIGPRRVAPDVFIWDRAITGPPGSATVREFYRRLPGSPGLLVLGSDPEIGNWIDGHPAGWGWLADNPDDEELLSTIDAVACGLVVVDRSFASDLAEPGSSAPEMNAHLSPREQEILTLVARGLTNREMADELGISENTVKFHISSLYEKLGVGSRSAAIGVAVRCGLIAL